MYKYKEKIHLGELYNELTVALCLDEGFLLISSD